MLLEVDARERYRAVPARLAEPIVNTVDVGVGRAAGLLLEATRELAANRGC